MVVFKTITIEKRSLLKAIVFIKIVFSLTIVNKDTSLTIFKNDRFLKRSFLIFWKLKMSGSFLKTIVFFPKTKQSFLKTIEKRNKNRLTTLTHNPFKGIANLITSDSAL